MKFFHLSDLHIGLKLLNHDLSEDQLHIFRQIIKAAGKEKPDAILIAGDIYDKSVPSAEAVEIFDYFIRELSKECPDSSIMLISGNHDNASRIDCFRAVLSRQGIHLIGQPPRRSDEYIAKVDISDNYGLVHFYLLPFVRPSMVRALWNFQTLDISSENSEPEPGNGKALSYDDTVKYIINREKINENERNVLVSHQFYLPSDKKPEDIERMDSEVRTLGDIDEVNAAILDRFDYAALGHIHKAMKVGKNAYYSGTPLCCSVSEAGQKKAIKCVELFEKGNVRVRDIPLYPLREIKIIRGSLNEVLDKSCSDYVRVELMDEYEGDGMDLQDRLRAAFPYLLEIRRPYSLHSYSYSEYKGNREFSIPDPFSLCLQFLEEVNEEEKALLKEVITSVQEVQ